MKSIKIIPENVNQIDSALQEAQKGCHTRTMDYTHLMKSLEAIENTFHGVPKSAMIGMQISIDYWAEDFPNAYTRKGRPESTVVLIERKSAGWYLMKASRTYTRRASRAIVVETMPEAVKTAIIDMHTHFQPYCC